jgi:nucleoside 2-deoxyribosyltransferase
MSALDERRYQVFVSSTFKDLESERQKVLQAVLEMKAFPAGMEMFPSADNEQWEFIMREIESSDYYVVIVAGMYGSLAPDGHSYTEKEYDFAISLGKPVMGFLARDLGQIIGDRLESDPKKKQKLLAFREKVAHGKLVKYFSNADELKGQVIHALVYSFQLRPLEGWVRARNSRRIEDLEQINVLQTQVMDLQATVTRLEAAQADPTAGFAQGQDVAEFEIALSTNGINISREPPVPKFTFKTTWSALLGTCFGNGRPDKREVAITNELVKFIVDQVRNTSVDFAEWVDEEPANAHSVIWTNSGNLVRKIRIQFLGLGLIDYAEEEQGRMRWILTEKGRLQLLATHGISRKIK